MKRILNLVIVAMAVISLQSCGPLLNILDIEQKVPAEFNVSMYNKTIAIVSSISDAKDSSIITNISVGMAEGLENRLDLEPGGIPVFNRLVQVSDSLLSQDDICSMGLEMGAELLVVIQNVDLGVLQLNLFPEAEESDGVYKVSYASLPFRTDLGVYDGITGEIIVKREILDTIYWELVTKSDIGEEQLLARLNNTIDEISLKLGNQFSNRFFDNWISAERYIYTLNSALWRTAERYASGFKWREAMDIWMRLYDSDIPIQKAAAAFNMALGLEMMERYDLAIEWLDLAALNYKLGVIEEYKPILEAKLEKR